MNIVYGCNLILVIEIVCDLVDIVVMEVGFGLDLGVEKFMDIKVCEVGFDLVVVVVVVMICVLKMYGGVVKDNLKEENVEVVKVGIVNLECYVNNIKKFGVELVVVINVFIYDIDVEVEYVKFWVKENNVWIVLIEVWEKGGKGGVDLVNEVLEVID